ncbi:MAG: DNA mismatch repair endonuclease MutL [Ardenticatenales bacterium]|nr:DNA mismatch repair endonuclease MutL [Ardenticatenales bacterium]
MPIRVLSEQLASQIAAGEVVERPASVVKELVENALDAGATTINVDVRAGGRKLIQVADDGAGIPAADMQTAFKRHATSKLQSVEDLNHIRTLGFRGEALAAISAVSQATMVTRAAGEAAGVRLVLEGGHPAGRETVGAPQGTVIAVENLFYNVPARLKFLKSIASERRLIDEFVTRYALAYPQVRFRLTHDGRVTFQSSGSGSLRDVLVAVYGPETARDLLEIHGTPAMPSEDDDDTDSPFSANPDTPPSGHAITVSGFAGPPSLHRANRGQITLFVNGRWIKDSSLTYAIIQAYHTLLPVGRYPIAVVFISLPYDMVDVNVHPAKTEVRFRQANAVFGAVQRAVRETIVADAPVRGFTQVRPEGVFRWEGSMDRPSFARQGDEDWGTGAADLRSQLSLTFPRTAPAAPFLPRNDAEHDHAPAYFPDENSADLGGERLPIMRVVGQVGAAYIVTEGPEGMFLLDQHAAHERILYEQFMAEWGQNGVAAQGLVAGAAVHVTPAQAALLEEQLERLAGLGFVVEPFGPNSFVVRSVPAILAHQDPSKALLAVVDELEEDETRSPLQGQIEARIIRRVCKTAAVKAGQPLSVAEMQAMIQQLELCRNPHTCPHGRPTLIHISLAQLARGFNRT